MAGSLPWGYVPGSPGGLGLSRQPCGKELVCPRPVVEADGTESCSLALGSSPESKRTGRLRPWPHSGFR